MTKGANENREPLAPFNQAEPFELAALAVLLSKGEDPAEHLQAAASPWAEAYQYREDLRHLYWGQEYKAIAKFTPPVRSVGMSEEFMDVKTACAKYSWGQRHLRDFFSELKDYGLALGTRPNSERLKQSVVGTVSLMVQHQSPTIDRLVLRIEEELKKRLLSLHDAFESNKLEKFASDRTLDAKIAAVAMFLEREENAQRTGLPRYQDFLRFVFDGSRTPDALRSTSASVLSFNYDRLFEAAFTDYFALPSSVDCYGKDWLNSGLDLLGKRPNDIAAHRFCFLKLHGTAATWVAEQDGEPRYACTPLHTSNLVIDDSFFWPPGRKPSPMPHENPEPLIVFPNEKDRAREGGTSFVFDEYIRAVWNHAEKLVSDAKEIWVIGYSFDPNDRKSIMDLLEGSPAAEIIIQNPSAEGIINELSLRYPGLATRLRPLRNPF